MHKLAIWSIFGYCALGPLVFPIIRFSYFAFLLFSLVGPLFFLILGLIVEGVFRNKSTELRLFITPVIWILLEIVFLESPISLPLNLGIAQYTNIAFIQIADVFSIFGLDFFILLINVLLTIALINYRKSLPLRAFGFCSLALGLVAGIYGYGAFQLHHPVAGTEKHSISILQGNTTKQSQKEGLYPALIKKAALMHPELMVLPECGAVGYIFNIPALYHRYETISKKHKVFLIVEAVEKEKGKQYKNVSLFTPQGRVLGSTKKARLVYFGESDFSRTNIAPQPVQTPKGLGTQVCYDACFPQVSRSLSKNGAQVLIILANDSFYGYSLIPALHLAETVFRAIENRKMAVFANNSGPSAFIDPYGRILEKTPYNTAGILTRRIAWHNEQTGFSRYGYTWLMLVMGLYSVILLGKAYCEKTNS